MLSSKNTLITAIFLASTAAAAEPPSISAASTAIAVAMAQFSVYDQARLYAEPASPELVRKLMSNLPADTSPAVKSDVKAMLSRSQLKQIPLQKLSAQLSQQRANIQ